MNNIQCIDCGKQITRGSKLGRCKSCSKTGILNINYLLDKIIYYCKTCKIKIFDKFILQKFGIIL